MRGGAAAGLIIVGLLLAEPALGQDARVRARQHFEEGRKLYQVGEYAAALGRFKQAFLLKEDPVFIFNIAQCHRQLGDSKLAVTFYRRYLGADPTASNRAQVEKLIAELERARPAAPDGTAAPPPPAPAPALRPAPPPADPASATAVLLATPPPPASVDEPIYGRWWFWTGVAAVVAGGIVGTVLLTRGTTSAGCSRGVTHCAPLPGS